MNRRVVAVFAVVDAVVCAGAWAADWDHDANIDDAVTGMMVVYREGGLEEAERVVGACYPVIETLADTDARLKQLEYCAGMDFAASKVDFDASRSAGRARTAFFHPDRMIERLAPLHDYIRDMNVQNQILRAWSASALQSLQRQGF